MEHPGIPGVVGSAAFLAAKLASLSGMRQHSRETLIIKFGTAQAWVLSAVSQIQHNPLDFPLRNLHRNAESQLELNGTSGDHLVHPMGRITRSR